MKTLLVLLTLLSSVRALAQDLVPATTEDIQEFDRQISRQAKPEKKSNFGSKVSEEARKLKDESSDQRGDFGQWVSSQRKKADQGASSAAAAAGAGNGNGNSSNSNAGGNGVGNTGNRGKSGDHTKK